MNEIETLYLALLFIACYFGGWVLVEDIIMDWKLTRAMRGGWNRKPMARHNI